MTTTIPDDLTDRVSRLDDEHRVIEALLAFAEARDAHDLDAALERCSDDVQLVVDGPAARSFGGADGIEELAEVWADDVRRVRFVMQFHSDVEVSLHDDRAVVSGTVIAPATWAGVDGDEGRWLSGRLLAELCRSLQGWMITSLRYEPTMHTPYEAGWAVCRFAD